MTSAGSEIASLYRRELDRLADQIAAYESDAALWSVRGSQKNPPGALALHIVGGLLAMIGATLGGTGYVRDRDGEFSGRDVPVGEVVRRIRECRDTIIPIVEGLGDDVLSREQPGPVPPHMQGATTRAFLVHLLWHLGWHQGQISYHALGV